MTFPPVYSAENSGSERHNDLPKVTQPATGRAGFRLSVSSPWALSRHKPTQGGRPWEKGGRRPAQGGRAFPPVLPQLQCQAVPSSIILTGKPAWVGAMSQIWERNHHSSFIPVPGVPAFNHWWLRAPQRPLSTPPPPAPSQGQLEPGLQPKAREAGGVLGQDGSQAFGGSLLNPPPLTTVPRACLPTLSHQAPASCPQELRSWPAERVTHLRGAAGPGGPSKGQGAAGDTDAPAVAEFCAWHPGRHSSG